MSNKSEIENILRHLRNLKKGISDLQKEEEALKKKIHRIMNRQSVNKLVGESLACTRGVRTKQSISKATVPEDVWDSYSHTVQYPVLTLKKVRQLD